MAQSDLKKLDNQLRIIQDKFTYFLLILAVLAIVLSIQETKDDIISTNLIPLGFAIISWFISFYIGCKQLKYTRSYLLEKHTYLQVIDGEHPEIGNHLDYITTASQGIKEAMEVCANKITKFGKLQFQLLILGGICYITWHLVEMIDRTPPIT